MASQNAKDVLQMMGYSNEPNAYGQTHLTWTILQLLAASELLIWAENEVAGFQDCEPAISV